MRTLNQPLLATLRLAFLGLVLLPAGRLFAADHAPLASWKEGAAKSAIVEFVAAATDPNSPRHVPPAERITCFDQDGTLWVEQPLYTQVVFALDRVKALAPRHPQWRKEQPFAAILTDDQAKLADLSIQDFERVVALTHSGVTVEEFQETVLAWLATARHPRFKRPYTELVYLPMLELLDYLRTHGFKTYIVTGGGQDFVRAYAQEVYGIPPEQVIGSAARTKYELRDGVPALIKEPETLLIDNFGGKVEGINMFIGRRPFAAFGNSTGDKQMLEWTGGGAPPRLKMLVHHDDAVREYDYGANSSIGTFSNALIAEARDRGWTVISMRDDWKRIFTFDE
jgi:phosphoglycolate phosphatase-like HAD superfamily hydrolase